MEVVLYIKGKLFDLSGRREIKFSELEKKYLERGINVKISPVVKRIGAFTESLNQTLSCSCKDAAIITRADIPQCSSCGKPV